MPQAGASAQLAGPANSRDALSLFTLGAVVLLQLAGLRRLDVGPLEEALEVRAPVPQGCPAVLSRKRDSPRSSCAVTE